MRKKLQTPQCPVLLFEYASIRKTITANAQALRHFISTIDAAHIDFIAHSLGGLLLLHYFTLVRDPRVRKVVLMGTPLRGSVIARAGAQIGVFKPLLGKNSEILQRGIEQWAAPKETIMIAGTRSLGVGKVFPNALAGPNDGTVAVEETHHPRLAAHYEIAQSHSSMLYSRAAIKIIEDFLSS